MWEIFAGTLMGILGGILGAKIVGNSMINRVRNEIFDYLESEEGQKMIFSIGALFGNGVKSGLGMNPRRGKFKWQDLISMAIAQFFQSKLPTSAVSSEKYNNPYEKFYRGE